MSRWDKEIWTPCRLGERFEYNDLGYRKVGWLTGIKADWMGNGGDHVAVRCKADCLRGYGNQRPCVLGLEPLPDGKCWTFEPKIRITPPEWIWDFNGAPADAFGRRGDNHPAPEHPDKRYGAAHEAQRIEGAPVLDKRFPTPGGADDADAPGDDGRIR